MTQFESDDFDARGLTDSDLDSETFVWPDGEAAEASKIAGAALGLLELCSQGRFRTVNLPLMDRIGVHVEASLERRGVVRMTSRRGVDIEVASGTATNYVRLDPSDRGIVGFDLSAERRIAFTLSDGREIDVVLKGDTATFRTLAESLSFVQIDPPDVAAWCEAVGDSWLRNYLSSYVARQDPWHAALAAALFLRLRELTLDQTRVAANRLVNGERDPEADPALVWMSRLTSAQVSGVFNLALAEADSLIGALEDLDSQVDDDSDLWRETLHSVSVRRDDLEAIASVLRGRAPLAVDELLPVLEYLDSIGKRMISSLSEQPEINDPRLRRVAIANPFAWWLRGEPT